MEWENILSIESTPLQNAHADKMRRPVVWVDNLGADDDGILLQEEGEVAAEVEAACEPPPLGHVQLRAALVDEGPGVEDGVLEGQRVEGPAVPDGAELGDGDAVRPRPRRRLLPPLPQHVAVDRAEDDGQRQCQDHLEDAIAMDTARN